MTMKNFYCIILIIICTALFLNSNMVLPVISRTNETKILLEEIGQIETPGIARHLVIRDNIAFVTDMGSMTSSYGGLFIFNITDPTNPIQLGHFYDGGRAHELLVENNIAYVADNTGGLEIINTSDFSNPVKISVFSGTINGVYKDDHILYLSDYYDGLILLDITNNTHPVEVARYSEIKNPQVNLIINDLAYIAVDTGLKVYNISNPSNIIEIASYIYDYSVYDFQIEDNFGYMACSRSIFEPGEGLKIWNCTDPLNMTIIGSFYDGGRTVGLHVFENIVIVGDYNDGLELIDIHDRFNPTKIAHYYDGGNATDVQMVEDLIYVADGDDGLEIIRITFIDRDTAFTSNPRDLLEVFSFFVLIWLRKKQKEKK